MLRTTRCRWWQTMYLPIVDYVSFTYVITARWGGVQRETLKLKQMKLFGNRVLSDGTNVGLCSNIFDYVFLLRDYLYLTTAGWHYNKKDTRSVHISLFDSVQAVLETFFGCSSLGTKTGSYSYECNESNRAHSPVGVPALEAGADRWLAACWRRHGVAFRQMSLMADYLPIVDYVSLCMWLQHDEEMFEESH